MPALGLGLGLALDSGAGNPDGLSLDLQFATDKTLTARKGPTPTFTRASSATQVGSTGLIEYAPENLALQSENFGTTWANNTGNALTLNDALSPTETLTADRIDFPATAAAGLIKQIQQSFSGAVAGNGPVTASVWLRTVSGASTVYLTLLDGGAPWQRVHVACNVTTAWTRFSVTLNTPTLSLFMTIGPDTRTTNGTPAQPAVQDAASVYAWGAQLERSSTARTYIPTTTAAVYGARFDHDPVTLASKGLLIEESRTNSILHSANFKNTTSSYWENLSTTTVTVDQTTSPDGGLNADLLTTSAAAFDCFTRRSNTYVGSTQYTYSIFLKQGPSSHRYVGLYIGVGITATQYPFFDFNNPTVVQIPSGTLVGTINSTKVDAYPNGWYRVSITFTTAVTPVNLFSGVYISTSNGTLPAAPTAGQDAYIWGIQLELGSFPTSYIPTTTASVVRSADLCTITGGDFTLVYNESEHTLFAEASGMSHAGFPSYLSFDNTTAAEQSTLAGYPSSNRVGCIESDGGATSAAVLLSVTLSQNNKMAAAMKLNSFQVSLNGALGTEDTSGTMATATSFKIGRNWQSVVLSGTYKQVKVFKKRLSNAKLQTLTT